MVKLERDNIRMESVAQLCVEYWKLAAATEKALEVLRNGDGRRIEAQLKFSKRQLDVLLRDLGLRLVDFSGERFHPGLAVSADNIGDYDEDEVLIVGQTIEPTVMAEMTVIRLGRVIVMPGEQREE